MIILFYISMNFSCLREILRQIKHMKMKYILKNDGLSPNTVEDNYWKIYKTVAKIC